MGVIPGSRVMKMPIFKAMCQVAEQYGLKQQVIGTFNNLLLEIGELHSELNIPVSHNQFVACVDEALYRWDLTPCRLPVKYLGYPNTYLPPVCR